MRDGRRWREQVVRVLAADGHPPDWADHSPGPGDRGRLGHILSVALSTGESRFDVLQRGSELTPILAGAGRQARRVAAQHQRAWHHRLGGESFPLSDLELDYLYCLKFLCEGYKCMGERVTMARRSFPLRRSTWAAQWSSRVAKRCSSRSRATRPADTWSAVHGYVSCSSIGFIDPVDSQPSRNPLHNPHLIRSTGQGNACGRGCQGLRVRAIAGVQVPHARARRRRTWRPAAGLRHGTFL